MIGAKDGKPTAKSSDLLRWSKEEWRNLTPLLLNDHKFYACGTKSKEQITKGLPSVCRPTVKVTRQTPTLAANYSMKDIAKAVSLKKTGNVIQWRKL